MAKKNIFIKRIYRITPKQDRIVKRNAKKFGGESAYVRRLIEEGVIFPVSSQ